ncbi:MAG: hypothetical protein HY429_04905 [Candidatus Levybacteria bacterium]|nr:hypothetical protein [Candidatus Levybacteria bacterium]
MQKKLLKKIVAHSFDGELLKKDFVVEVANMLSRKDLKQYVKALKVVERKKEVIISLALTPTKKQKHVFSDLYTNKRIIYRIDKRLGAGVKIEENDKEFAFNLRQILDGLVQHVVSQ